MVGSASWDAFNALNDKNDPKGEVNALVEAWSRHSPNRLRPCIRYVDAMYGRVFEDDHWNRFFYGPITKSQAAPPYRFFRPNPGFRPSLLTLTDKAFLEVLQLSISRAEAAPTPHEANERPYITP